MENGKLKIEKGKLKMEKMSIAALLLAVVLSGCASGPRGLPPKGGIQNFDRVNRQVYRGAQPDIAGIRYLKKRGIRTVINLRTTAEEWRGEQRVVEAAGMKYAGLPMAGLLRPENGTMRKALDILEGRKHGFPLPAFVHCEFGCERTGTVIACYRIEHNGAGADESLREADKHAMSKFAILQRQYVRDFAGIQRTPAPKRR